MKKSRFIFIVIVGLVSILALIYYNYYSFQKKSSAALDKSVRFDESSINRIKYLKKTNGTKKFSFYSQSNTGMYAFASGQQSLGLAALTGKDISIIKNGSLQGLLTDQEIERLKLKSKKTDSSQHFFYEQNINSIPVYGSQVIMHINNRGQLYGIDGTLVSSQVVTEQKISLEEAQNIALNKAKKDSGINSLYVYQSEKVVLNKKIIKLDEDEKNYLVLSVWIRSSQTSEALFSKKYMVDLMQGKILFEEELFLTALNRQIQTCQGFDNCQTIRSEGQPEIADQDANKTYNSLGKTYNYFKNTFNLDSFDGKGAPLVGVVHLSINCPNAFFDLENKKMFLCNGMVADDVIGHEIGHGVTGDRLIYLSQSGALNESISDIFGSGVDNNWTLGEDISLGVTRRMDDPTVYNQPDRLFSNKFYCGLVDYGGVHVNNGVFNKAFYLMSDGGNFNGCNLQGIGRDKAQKIVYKALTNYVIFVANFKDMYNAVLSSCDSLYGLGSSDCNNIKRAMQAVEMDQQPADTYSGPICINIQRQTPSCVESGLPTSALSPTDNISTNTPVPTYTTAPLPTLTPLPSLPQVGNTTIKLNLRFQGITAKPSDIYNKIRTKITLVSDQNEIITSQADFVATNSGVWTGKAYFNLSKTEGKKYKILVKGPKHIQKKICEENPTEAEAGYYRCNDLKISLIKGPNEFDFSKIVLLAGDLPAQDGLINSYDLSQIRQHLGFNSLTVLNNLDVNLDGVVNTQDYSLVIHSLSTKFDD